jgi:hypothetical protein
MVAISGREHAIISAIIKETRGDIKRELAEARE